MAYFPMFVDLEGADCLIVGGGTVALRKAEKLMPFGAAITVIAPQITAELSAMPGVVCVEREPRLSDLEGRCLVIAATDDCAWNKRISAFCRERRIPVNAVDDRENCSFLFPALVQSGPLTVGISTAGASPTAAVYLKQQIRQLIPERMEDILVWLEQCRPVVRETVPEEKQRSRIHRALFESCLEKGRPLTRQELRVIIEEGAQ